MKIYSLLDKSTILANLSVDNKDDLLHKMIDVFKGRVTDEQLEDIRNSVFEREKIMSTGVGKNLAIPHGKVASLDDSLASFSVLKQPIDFDSIDEKPVKMAFLLIGPEKRNSTHIKLLSRISRLMNSSSFRDTLSNCKTPEEILDTFKQEEIQYFGT